jgi:hypothetical protein
MKNASRTMMKIGRIFNIIFIPLFALLAVILMIVGLAGIVAGTVDSNQDAVAAGVTSVAYAVFFIFAVIFNIVALIICTKKNNEIEAGNNEVAPRVFIIVFGALSDNPFYILAGIFSLVARSQEANSNTTVIEENQNDDSETKSE